MPTSFVDLETAKSARGLRLVVVANVPSPWSEAAKGIFHLKKVPLVVTKLEAGDKATKEWTRARNAPVAMYEDEPGKTGWAEILELAERIAPSPSLVPHAPEDRVRMFGLAHEVMGDGGLLWSSRLLTIHAGITTDGAQGFPTVVAQYLGKRYGYSKEAVASLDRVRSRFAEGVALLLAQLGDRTYYFGDAPTALDVYSAAAVNLMALPPEDQCPLFPPIRMAFDSMKKLLGDAPKELVAHRDRMYRDHLELPLTF